ncbi:MAG: hypothetical protein EOM87_09725, partial [Clostridia bacterium]|nr:hypothetical protein [Clostridia bacterium]
MAKYNNPAIKGFDDYGNPIGDPQMILYYDQRQTMNDNVYPSDKQVKDWNKEAKKNNRKKQKYNFGNFNYSVLTADEHGKSVKTDYEVEYDDTTVKAILKHDARKKQYSAAEKKSFHNGVKRGYFKMANKAGAYKA